MSAAWLLLGGLAFVATLYVAVSVVLGREGRQLVNRYARAALPGAPGDEERIYKHKAVRTRGQRWRRPRPRRNEARAPDADLRRAGEGEGEAHGDRTPPEQFQELRAPRDRPRMRYVRPLEIGGALGGIPDDGILPPPRNVRGRNGEQ